MKFCKDISYFVIYVNFVFKAILCLKESFPPVNFNTFSIFLLYNSLIYKRHPKLTPDPTLMGCLKLCLVPDHMNVLYFFLSKYRVLLAFYLK